MDNHESVSTKVRLREGLVSAMLKLFGALRARSRKRFLSTACRYAIAITQMARSSRYLPVPEKLRVAMVKQNLALLNADGKTHCRWCAPKEIERLLKSGAARKIAEKGKPVRYALKSFPGPSNSAETAAQLTPADMKMLAGLSERDLKRIARAAHEPEPEPSAVRMLKLVQRWMGHGLIGQTPVTELIAQA